MLQTLEEVKKIDYPTGQVFNGVDSPNLLSVDSTEPLPMVVDELKPEDETVPNVTDSPKPEVKVEVKKEQEVKVDPPQKKEEKEEPSPEVKSDAVQKRIDDLTKKRRTAERERDFERTKRLELEAELKKVKGSIPATDKPKKENFEDLDEYYEALTDWKVEQKWKASQEEATKKTSEVEEKTAVDETYKELDGIMEWGRGKYKDFNSLVLDENLVISPEMTEVILLSENAAEVLYYLGNNPDESAEIAKMPPLKAAKEIGKIEVKIGEGLKKEVKKDTPAPAPAPSPAKKQSSAPEPITPVTTTGVVDRDPNQMSPREYRAWRERDKG